jgi:hypothetical protein
MHPPVDGQAAAFRGCAELQTHWRMAKAALVTIADVPSLARNWTLSRANRNRRPDERKHGIVLAIVQRSNRRRCSLACLLLALCGPRAMPGLSPECEPKRTSADTQKLWARAPRLERSSVRSRRLPARGRSVAIAARMEVRSEEAANWGGLFISLGPFSCAPATTGAELGGAARSW